MSWESWALLWVMLSSCQQVPQKLFFPIKKTKWSTSAFCSLTARDCEENFKLKSVAVFLLFQQALKAEITRNNTSTVYQLIETRRCQTKPWTWTWIEACIALTIPAFPVPQNVTMNPSSDWRSLKNYTFLAACQKPGFSKIINEKNHQWKPKENKSVYRFFCSEDPAKKFSGIKPISPKDQNEL